MKFRADHRFVRWGSLSLLALGAAFAHAEIHPLPPPPPAPAPAPEATEKLRAYPCPVTESVMRQYDKQQGGFSFLDISAHITGDVDNKCPSNNSGLEAPRFEENYRQNPQLNYGIPMDFSTACAQIPSLARDPIRREEVLAGTHTALKRFDLGMKSAAEGIASIDSILGDRKSVTDSLCASASLLPEAHRWCQEVQTKCENAAPGEFDQMVEATHLAAKNLQKVIPKIEDPFGDVKRLDLWIGALAPFKEHHLRPQDPNSAQNWNDALARIKKHIPGGRARTCERRADLRHRAGNPDHTPATITTNLPDDFQYDVRIAAQTLVFRTGALLGYEDLSPEDRAQCDKYLSFQSANLALAPWLNEESFGFATGDDKPSSYALTFGLEKGPAALAQLAAIDGSDATLRMKLKNRLRRTRDALSSAFAKYSQGTSCLLGESCLKGSRAVWSAAKANWFGEGSYQLLGGDSLDRYAVIQDGLKDAPALDLQNIPDLDGRFKYSLIAAQCRQVERHKAKVENDWWVNTGVSVALTAASLGAGTVFRGAVYAGQFATAGKMVELAAGLRDVAVGAQMLSTAFKVGHLIWTVPAVLKTAGQCHDSGLEHAVAAPEGNRPECSAKIAGSNVSRMTQTALLRNCLLKSLSKATPFVTDTTALDLNP